MPSATGRLIIQNNSITFDGYDKDGVPINGVGTFVPSLAVKAVKNNAYMTYDNRSTLPGDHEIRNGGHVGREDIGLSLLPGAKGENDIRITAYELELPSRVISIQGGSLKITVNN